MAIRFRKSKSLGGLGRVYLTKRGVSLSLGPRGKSISIGKRGVYGNIGIPGTGLSYRKKLSGSSRRSNSNSTSAMSYKSSTNSGYNEVKDYTMKKPLLVCGLLFVLLFILTLMPVAFIHQTAISTLIAFIWFFVFLAWVISVIWLPIAFIKARKSKKAKMQADKEYADALAYQQKMEEEKQQAELKKAKTEEHAGVLTCQQEILAETLQSETAQAATQQTNSYQFKPETVKITGEQLAEIEKLKHLQRLEEHKEAVAKEKNKSNAKKLAEVERQLFIKHQQELFQQKITEVTALYKDKDYPVFESPPIILKKDEVCHLRYAALMFERLEAISEYEDDYKKVGFGWIYLTNQRVVFLGEGMSATFQLNKLVEVVQAQYPTHLKITNDGVATSKYFTFSKDIEFFDFSALLSCLISDINN